MRTGGDAGGSSMGGGRLTPRPDTLRPGTRAGSGPAPQNVIFIGRLIVVFGTGAGTGIFFYSGSPAHGNPPILAITTASSDPYGNVVSPSVITDVGMPVLMYSPSAGVGNLVASWSPFATVHTDVFGNTYQPGFTSYGLQNVGFNSGFATFWSGSLSDFASTGSIAAGISTLREQLILSSPALTATGNAQAEMKLVAGTPGIIESSFISAFNPGFSTAAPWVAASLINSFSAGGTSPRFRLEVQGLAGTVRLSGAVNTGAVNAANTAMFNLPAAYRPARQFGFAGQTNNITAWVAGGSVVQVNTTGDVLCVPASTAGKFLLLDGITFELD